MTDFKKSIYIYFTTFIKFVKSKMLYFTFFIKFLLFYFTKPTDSGGNISNILSVELLFISIDIFSLG